MKRHIWVLDSAMACMIAAALALAAAAPVTAQESAVSEAGNGAAETAPADTGGIGGLAANVDYLDLGAGAQAIGGEGHVLVTEVFMYGCPHCFTLEPELKAWLDANKGSVQLHRVPAPWSPTAMLHARAYYAAERLGKLDEMHDALFQEIHVNENPLDSKDTLAAFFARFGVGRQAFDEAFDSPEVDRQIQDALQFVMQSKVVMTPSIIVANRYLTNGAMAGSIERWMYVLGVLVEHTVGR